MVKPKNIIDSSGWTWIFRNNKKTMEKQIEYPFHKEVKKLATSFYVSKIPNSVDSKEKFNDLPSFDSVTNGIAKPTVDTSLTNAIIRALVLDDQELINIEDPSMVLLVKLKDVNSMSNIIAGGLDHVIPVIRLPIEHGISRERVNNLYRVSQDAVLLRVFPFTLTGAVKRWVARLTPGVVNTWDLLKKAFIQRTSSKNISSNSNTDGLATIIGILDNLGRDMKKLKEIVHAIQVRCQICEGPHLDKECPLNEEVKHVEEVKYGEFGHLTPFNGSNGANFCVGPPGYYTRTDNQTLSEKKRPNLVKTINKYMEGAAKIQAEMPVILGRHLLATAHAKVDIFRKTISLEVQESNEEVFYRCSLITQEANGGLRENLTSTKKKLHWCTLIFCMKEGVYEIWASCSPFEEKCNEGSLFHEIKCYWESENDVKQIDVEWEDLSLNDWLRIRFGDVSETSRDKILRDHWRKIFRNKYDNSEDFKDPDGCEESKKNKILGIIINKLHDEWFKGTHEDDVDLEDIIDCLVPTLYDGYIDLNDEEYKERKCRLLGMSYIKPPQVLIEKVKVTRHSVDPGEVYTKIKVLKVEELSRTRGNIAIIRAGIME
nr:RNA-directed DNA polymerase, eukaryota, reverse transcriptase zinc-binding domain protein [Tanacetum cinerariifolium]